jgi:hypothetical protein
MLFILTEQVVCKHVIHELKSYYLTMIYKIKINFFVYYQFAYGLALIRNASNFQHD